MCVFGKIYDVVMMVDEGSVNDIAVRVIISI